MDKLKDKLIKYDSVICIIAGIYGLSVLFCWKTGTSFMGDVAAGISTILAGIYLFFSAIFLKKKR
ncbi:MAG: hypothetical protein ABI199_08470 [Bacteroidia bacterium]